MTESITWELYQADPFGEVLWSADEPEFSAATKPEMERHIREKYTPGTWGSLEIYTSNGDGPTTVEDFLASIKEEATLKANEYFGNPPEPDINPKPSATEEEWRQEMLRMEIGNKLQELADLATARDKEFIIVYRERGGEFHIVVDAPTNRSLVKRGCAVKGLAEELDREVTEMLLGEIEALRE